MLRSPSGSAPTTIDTLLLDETECFGGVSGTNQGNVLQRPGRGLGHNRRNRRHAPVGRDHALQAHGRSAADDRAQVVRVLHTIEERKEAGTPLAGVSRKSLQRQAAHGRAQGHHSLVTRGAGFLVQACTVEA